MMRSSMDGRWSNSRISGRRLTTGRSTSWVTSSSCRSWKITMSERAVLLTDNEMISFIIRGYHIVEADFPAGFNEAIYDELQQLKENPGDGILDRVPKLYQVYDHPRVLGALISLLGEDVRM